MDYIRINNDEWSADPDTVYAVLEYSKDSTGVSLVLENYETKQVIHRIVAEHKIEWLESKDI